MRVRLSDRERALLFALLRQPVAGVLLEKLPKCVGWGAERVADVLAPLADGGWVEVAAPRVRLAEWAAAWLDHEAIPSTGRWRPIAVSPWHESLGHEPLCTEREEEQVFVLTGSDAVWRELHARDCDCGACREGAPPSGTRPRPPSCATCKGRPLPPLWECLRCGRGGRDRERPPLPKVRRRLALRRDNGLKGGRG